MTPKQLRFKIKGMQRDVGESSFTPDFAFENMNIRISTNEDNGLLNITNEKGTLEVPDISVSNILGYAVIENQIVLFSHSDKDYIYLLYKTDDVYQLDALFSGDLNFDLEHPIETLIDIENENIQKIYWVDGKNQPRVINIKANIDPDDTTQFDFLQSAGRGYMEVEHSENAGAFNAGVIQYAFTYFNKYDNNCIYFNYYKIYD